MMSIDLAGPLYPDRNDMRYILVAVWVGWHNHKVLSIPFVELVSSRLAVEVFEALTRIVNSLENLVSDALPSLEHATNRLHGLRILRLHSDRASEFVGVVARDWARKNGVHTTQTGAHSPESNGRAECCIRVIKSMVRRALVSTGFPLHFWGYAARHSAEILRSHNLRKAGDKKTEQPLPFGGLVAIRRPGGASTFKPFEKRGRIGRLVLHEVGTRRCFVVDDEDVIWKGFSARPVLDLDLEDTDTVPVEYSDAGWTRIRLITGRAAWFHPDMGLFRLTPPTLMEDIPFERLVETEALAENASLSESESSHQIGVASNTCVVSETERMSPDALVVHESRSPDVDDSCETSRSDTDIACGSNPKEDEEGYCCGCGKLVWQRCSHVIDYCPHFTCFDCRTSYHFDGARVWACRHHPELNRVAAVQEEQSSNNVLSHACYSCDRSETMTCTACPVVPVKRVTFAVPLVERLIEFEVENMTRSTHQHARGSRCLGKNVVANLAQPIATAKAQARKRREAHALTEMPNTTSMTLSKAVSISAEAVRGTTGQERELWKSALESELKSLDDNRVFYKVSAERAQELQRAGAASVPARLVLVLKPDEQKVKRKARIVACGNFIGQYENYDVSNLDAAVFRAVLQVAAKRDLRIGVLDIRTAFLHAGIEPGRMVIVRPPGLLRDFNLQSPGEAWVLCKALYGLRESPGLWAEHRDGQLKDMVVTINGRRHKWLQGQTHSSVWLLVKEEEKER
eukprot:6217154-Amphidinium_carterae.1